MGTRSGSRHVQGLLRDGKSAGTSIRDAAPGDVPFMQRMLYEAANQGRGGSGPEFGPCINEPSNARFWVGWPRGGDIGVVAEESGQPVGAAWARYFSGKELLPWDEPNIPVLVIAVEARCRARGVGTLLMGGLIDLAEASGAPALDLTT